MGIKIGEAAPRSFKPYKERSDTLRFFDIYESPQDFSLGEQPLHVFLYVSGGKVRIIEVNPLVGEERDWPQASKNFRKTIEAGWGDPDFTKFHNDLERGFRISESILGWGGKRLVGIHYQFVDAREDFATNRLYIYSAQDLEPLAQEAAAYLDRKTKERQAAESEATRKLQKKYEKAAEGL